MLIRLLLLSLCITPCLLAQPQLDYNDISDKTVVIRLEPQPRLPNFLKSMQPPKTIETPRPKVTEAPPLPRQTVRQPTPEEINRFLSSHNVPRPQPAAVAPAPGRPIQQNNLMNQLPQGTQIQPRPQQFSGTGFSSPAPPGVPPQVVAQQPLLPNGQLIGGQEFVPNNPTVPPAPMPNIPPDVQNQLIKFFGLDSFGIPGLTGNHPNGFAGAVQELRAAGIPVQGLPLAHVNNGQDIKAPQNDVLEQANPAFRNQLNDLLNEGKSEGPFHSSGVPLPDPKPGENGLIGLLSSSIRKLVKDSGVADALSQGIPNVLGGGNAGLGSAAGAAAADASAASINSNSAASNDPQTISQDKETSVNEVATHRDIRRQQTASQRAVNGLVAALGGGGNGPAHAGLPKIPGIPLLPGGIPRNSQGQIDVVNLIGSITRRISNGTTLADVLPPEQLQTLADNVTDALLPPTPEGFDLSKFMGRWFEGINSPRATEQRCVVHHYGGLTQNDKTATFTALKIYREGSEFGQVRYAIGYAFRGGNKDAMLQLHTSENADAQPFWIYKLGPEGTDPFGNKQYEYAIVSNWVKYPVTVLVRDPDTFKSKYEPEVLRWLEDQGFINGFVRAFNLIQPSSYGSCQYADSTFELFGKK